MSDAIDLALTLFEILEILDGTDAGAVHRSSSFWLTQDQSVIEMRMCGEELCGYLASKIDIKSDIDQNNAKTSVCGLPIILGLKAKSVSKWHGGWLVDPDTGWAYNARVNFKKNGQLIITAFDKTEMLSEDLKWRQVKKENASCYNKKQK